MNRAAATAPQVLYIDADDPAGAALPLGGGACGVARVVGIAAARRALEQERFDLIVLDPRACGEAASVLLLDALPARNGTTAVLLYCEQMPSEACRDRANLLLLKHMTTAPALWAMIAALAASSAGAASRELW